MTIQTKATEKQNSALFRTRYCLGTAVLVNISREMTSTSLLKWPSSTQNKDFLKHSTNQGSGLKIDDLHPARTS